MAGIIHRVTHLQTHKLKPATREELWGVITDQTAEIENLKAERTELVAALKDALRILQAVRMSAGLGKGQIERVERHTALLAKLEAK